MSGATGSTGADGDAEVFAELLRGLKERSGLSYGALAKRLHMSTSTLHRYCNGSATPADYAPVERLARVCRATPAELVELHRSWILADAARGRKAAGQPGPERVREAADGRTAAPTAAGDAAVGAGTAEAAADAGRTATGATEATAADTGRTATGATEATAANAGRTATGAAEATAADAGRTATSTAEATAADTGRTATSGAEAVAVQGGPADGGAGGERDQAAEPVVAGPGPSTALRPTRRRTAVIAAVAAAAVLGAVVLVVNLPSSGGGTRGTAQGPAGASGAATGPADGKRPSPSLSASPSPTPSSSPSPSASASADAERGKPSAGASKPAAVGGGDGDAGDGGDGNGAEPQGSTSVNVATRPFVYEGPCSQHFLVDSEPSQVGPPAPTEQDAPRWAAAYGAVSSDEQRVAVTLQGSGKDTIVLDSLQVRVVSKGAPPAWNDYAMGSGCGGEVESASFDVDLDSGSPTVTTKNGQRGFPFSVTESDPLVFYVTAHTRAHDVRWDLTLKWSSGDRQGTVHIDNDGTPFRTSGSAGRPSYHYPLGGGEWIKREEELSQ
ncbi:helix-turn-helix transcriptional regulator [Streptomyces sp. NPDC046887]|uniref:helix-turn-helix domain-containing protein n=1 Tax=Streptomyces sp. NPDC046887 TaxID=3155472 RepID=UPI0033D9A628